MKPKNPKLIIGLAAVGIVLFAGFIYSISHTPSPKQQGVNNPNSVANYELESGDTNTEVLRTVVANQKEESQQNQKQEQELQKQQQEIQSGEFQKISQIKSSLTEQINQIKDSLQSEINTQHQALNSGENNSTSNAGYTFNGENSSGGSNSSGMIGTINDISQAFASVTASQGSDNRVAAVYSSNADNNQQSQGAPSLPSDGSNQSQAQSAKPKLMYAIPDGSTIGNVYMMTATLAEVPVSGRLIAPAWPFKAIIGRQDLMATNGQMLPDQIAGAIIQGHAIGNMGLGCATMYVDKITYTFPDGHFWVYPSETDSNSNDGKQVYPSHSLGMLTLPDGTQCINGLYLTDAPKVLLNLTALGAGSNAGNVMANQQISTVSNGLTGQTGTNITGSAGKLFGWSMLAGGSTAALNYYQARVSDIFDAIFLPASTNHEPTRLTFNVQKTIPIDYDPNAVMDASKGRMSSNLNNLD